MPFYSEGRSVLRNIAMGGALLGTLTLAGPASAQIGGAKPSFANHPALESVTITPGGVALYDFDRPVTVTGGAGAFGVGGYDANNGQTGVAAPTVDLIDQSIVRVDVTPAATEYDEDDFTFGFVSAGAVAQAAAPNQPNFDEALPISGADGQDATRGRTVGPDLLSVTRNVGANQLTYCFDEEVSIGVGATANLGFYLEDGTPITSGVVQNEDAIDEECVDVTFPIADLVTTGITAFATAGGVTSLNFVESGQAIRTVPIPGAPAQFLNGPTLISAELVQSGGNFLTQAVFTFDRNLEGDANAAAGAFTVETTTGASYTGTTAQYVGDGPFTQVRVTFAPGLQLELEHIVAANYDGTGGLRRAGTADLAVASGGPIGGNSSALITGFTSAPDPVDATINQDINQVSIEVDARLLTDPTADAFILRNTAGNVVAPAAPVVLRVVPGGLQTQPGRARIVLDYGPADIDSAVAVEVDNAGAGTPITGTNTSGGTVAPDTLLGLVGTSTVYTP